MNQKQIVTQSEEGIISVEKGQVPVIRVTSGDLISEFAVGINFLRSGSPKVQFLLSNRGFSKNDAEVAFNGLVNDVLPKICTESETYTFERKYPVYEIILK